MLAGNFQCKNFFQLSFFVEMQTKRVPPNPRSDWGTRRNGHLEEGFLKTMFTFVLDFSREKQTFIYFLDITANRFPLEIKATKEKTFDILPWNRQ